MRAYVGTSGFSYKEWKGGFYPDDLPTREMLQFYSRQLPTVEINNTFYRMPKEELLLSWCEQVPSDFRFVLKASRRITHFKKLANVEDDTAYLLDVSSVMKERLGAILFQLPPNFRANPERLGAFLSLIGERVRAAFEFRHPSWFEDPVAEILRDRGAALVLADTGGESDAPRLATADWGYLRLRRSDYSEENLEEWSRWLHAQKWKQVFVFFKHEDEAAGPRLARTFLGKLNG